MQALKIMICNSPEEAPNYARDSIDIRSASITGVVIILKGMTSGGASVDFQITDADGNEFVAMLSGGLVHQIGAALRGAENR